MKKTRTHEQQRAWIDTGQAAAVALVLLFAAGMFGGSGYFIGVRQGDPTGWVGVWIAAFLLLAAAGTTVVAVRYYLASRPTPPDPHEEALHLGRELLHNKKTRHAREALEWTREFDRLKREADPNRLKLIPVSWSAEREPKPIYREIVGADGEITVLRTWGGQVRAPGAKMPPKQKSGTQPVPPYRHDDL